MPRGGRNRPRPSILPKGRPQPLVDHRAAQEGAEVVLTFAAIEALIGHALPTAAYVVESDWSGTDFAHTRGSHALGWRGRVDRDTWRVRFGRDAEEG